MMQGILTGIITGLMLAAIAGLAFIAAGVLCGLFVFGFRWAAGL